MRVHESWPPSKSGTANWPNESLTRSRVSQGISGSEGYFRLREKLERAIREAHENVRVLLKEFAQVLNQQAEAIQQAMRDSVPTSRLSGKRTRDSMCERHQRQSHASGHSLSQTTETLQRLFSLWKVFLLASVTSRGCPLSTQPSTSLTLAVRSLN